MNVSPDGYDPSYFAKLFDLEERSFWFRGRSDLIDWALDHYFPSARSFLEVGCGNGFVLNRIRQMHPDWHLVGAELLEEGLDRARMRMPQGVELRQLDAVDMAYSEAFDVVGAFDVIEHIGPDDKAVASVFRALRPGGGFILTVPQHKWLWSGADVAARHVRRYTRGELRALLSDAGFHVERVASFVSLLLPAMMATRLVRKSARDIEAELDVAQPLNAAGYAVMRVEAALVRGGMNFPAGGSIIAVARKPD